MSYESNKLHGYGVMQRERVSYTPQLVESIAVDVIRMQAWGNGSKTYSQSGIRRRAQTARENVMELLSRIDSFLAQVEKGEPGECE